MHISRSYLFLRNSPVTRFNFVFGTGSRHDLRLFGCIKYWERMLNYHAPSCTKSISLLVYILKYFVQFLATCCEFCALQRAMISIGRKRSQFGSTVRRRPPLGNTTLRCFCPPSTLRHLTTPRSPWLLVGEHTCTTGTHFGPADREEGFTLQVIGTQQPHQSPSINPTTATK